MEGENRALTREFTGQEGRHVSQTVVRCIEPITAVIPAADEVDHIAGAVAAARAGGCHRILVVENGSRDGTAAAARRADRGDVTVLSFRERLGHDVPRAVGATVALTEGAAAVLFLDGDSAPDLGDHLRQLATGFRSGYDLCLTQCLPVHVEKESPARRVLAFRRLLNQSLGIYPQILTATPSHGPHVASRRFLTHVPLRELAVPPVTLAHAVRHGFRVGVGATIGHRRLGSKLRSADHGLVMTATIIGDCVEALNVIRGEPRRRRWGDEEFIGYAPARRWDLLAEFLGRAGSGLPPLYNTLPGGSTYNVNNQHCGFQKEG